jgi:hypothetical protein
MRISGEGKSTSYSLLRDINDGDTLSTCHIGQIGRPTISIDWERQAHEEEHRQQHIHKTAARKTKRDTHS